MIVLQSLKETLDEQVKDEHTHVCYDGTGRKIDNKLFLLITNVSVRESLLNSTSHKQYTVTKRSTPFTNSACITDIKTYLCVFSWICKNNNYL